MDLTLNDDHALRAIVSAAKEAVGNYPNAIGAAEIVAGSVLLCGGIKSGAIKMGIDLVAHTLGIPNPGVRIGAYLGAGLGALMASVGRIGIAAGGGAFAVSAWVLAAGGALILKELGEVIGSSIYAWSHQFDPANFAIGGSAMVLGLFLIKDGVRRIVGANAESFGLTLSLPHLARQPVIESLYKVDRVFGGGEALGAYLGAMTGFAVGGSFAISSATLLGSKVLGSAAVAMGLISPPLWPIVVGVLGGAAGGAALLNRVKHIASR